MIVKNTRETVLKGQGDSQQTQGQNVPAGSSGISLF